MDDNDDNSKILEELIKEKIKYYTKYETNKWFTENDRTKYLDRENNLLQKLLKREIENYEIKDYIYDTYEYIYNIPTSQCPICSFGSLRDNDVVAYLYKKAGLSEKELKKEIKELFKSYEEFKEFMK